MFVLNYSLFLKDSTEKTFKFNKNTVIYKLPYGPVYKMPCVPFIKTNPFLLYVKFLHCQKNQTL